MLLRSIKKWLFKVFSKMIAHMGGTHQFPPSLIFQSMICLTMWQFTQLSDWITIFTLQWLLVSMGLAPIIFETEIFCSMFSLCWTTTPYTYLFSTFFASPPMSPYAYPKQPRAYVCESHIGLLFTNIIIPSSLHCPSFSSKEDTTNLSSKNEHIVFFHHKSPLESMISVIQSHWL